VHACLVEAATPLADRAAVLPDPAKHLLYDAGFIKNHGEAGLSRSLLLVHIPIAKGRITEDTDSSCLCGMPLASSTPFENRGPFVCGNHALHWQEPLIFRGVPQRPIQKNDVNARLALILPAARRRFA
jgi:hypothetical protein